MEKAPFHIWEFRQAGKTVNGDYCLMSPNCVRSVLYSDVEKCREAVKRALEKGEIRSSEGWTQENWTIPDDRCVVINSGGCAVFSFTRLTVE